MKKKEQMYIISGSINYADEFDVVYISIMPKSKWLGAKKLLEEFGASDSFDIYFGTNEALEIGKHGLAEVIKSAKKLSDAEVKFLRKINISRGTLDIIAQLTDRIEEINE